MKKKGSGSVGMLMTFQWKGSGLSRCAAQRQRKENTTTSQQSKYPWKKKNSKRPEEK